MSANIQQDYIARYWEQPRIWQEELNELDRVRVPTTVSMVPVDVETILEVGCGNGHLSNRLAARNRVIGLDLSRTALGSVKAAKLQASAGDVSLKDNSVDLVLCADLLEHLPDSLLIRTASEMKRVGRRYILIGVPYRERFEAGYIKCGACGYVFNGYGHLRSFTRKKLDSLFRGWTRIATAFVGWPRKYYSSFLLLRQQRLGNTYWGAGPNAVCPACGNAVDSLSHRNLIQRAVSKACHLANEFLDRLIPECIKPQTEILCLYRKDPAGQSS